MVLFLNFENICKVYEQTQSTQVRRDIGVIQIQKQQYNHNGKTKADTTNSPIIKKKTTHNSFMALVMNYRLIYGTRHEVLISRAS